MKDSYPLFLCGFMAACSGSTGPTIDQPTQLSLAPASTDIQDAYVEINLRARCANSTLVCGPTGEFDFTAPPIRSTFTVNTHQLALAPMPDGTLALQITGFGGSTGELTADFNDMPGALGGQSLTIPGVVISTMPEEIPLGSMPADILHGTAFSARTNGTLLHVQWTNSGTGLIASVAPPTLERVLNIAEIRGTLSPTTTVNESAAFELVGAVQLASIHEEFEYEFAGETLNVMLDLDATLHYVAAGVLESSEATSESLEHSGAR